MSDHPHSSPYDTLDYLNTREDIVGYLEAVIEDGDEQVLLAALKDAVRAAKRVIPAEMKELPDNPDELSLTDLILLLHALGFELSLRAKQAA